MRLQKISSVFLLALLAPFVASAQEVVSYPTQSFERTVLAIHEMKFRFTDVGLAYGTGFCLDPPCRFILTNYHVAELTKPRKIAGHKIVAQYLATGPNDQGATLVRVSTGPPAKFTYSRDLALFELDHPLPLHHGMRFSLDELQLGQQVDIYAYPLESMFQSRKLIRFPGRFTGMTQHGLLALDYEPSGGHRIRPGSSGGVVVDHRTQGIVGVVSGIADDGALMAVAVPVQSVAEFVAKVRPDVAQSIFTATRNAISSTSADLYPKLEPSHVATLQRRAAEPLAVKLLRNRAQALADSMLNFIALQYVEWGSADKLFAASATFEIRVLDGNQRFREYPDGKKELQDLPFPPLNTAIVTGGEWSELPRLVALEPRLQIEQMPGSLIDGRPIKVFRYRGDAEDRVCRWRSSLDFGFFGINKDTTVACYGEVWTDENTNILRMSEHYELPGPWKNYEAVMTYGWLARPGEAPRPIPTAIASKAEYHGKTYWCRSQFLHYQVFASEVRMTMK